MFSLKIKKINKNYIDLYKKETSERNYNTFSTFAIAIAIIELGLIIYQSIRFGERVFRLEYFALYTAVLTCSCIFILIYRYSKNFKYRIIIDILYLLTLSLFAAYTALLEFNYGSSLNIIYISWLFFVSSLLYIDLKYIISLIITSTLLIIVMIITLSDSNVDVTSTVLNYAFLGTLNVFLSIPFYNIKIEHFNQKMEIHETNDILNKNNKMLEILNHSLEISASTDALTGVLNRMAFNELVEAGYSISHAASSPISLIMLDVDHFKSYNDSLGHLKGDECLKSIAKLISKALKRSSDKLFRYGGEEFAVLLNDTDINGAVVTTNRILELIREAKIPHPVIGDIVTISAGIHSVIPSADDMPKQLIEKADIALYHAKENGRNNYCVFDNIN